MKVFSLLLPVVVLVTNGEVAAGTYFYKHDKGLTKFPPNVDSYLTINLNNNNITSLKGANASNSDTLDVSNNQITNLTADSLKGFPNLTILISSGNPIVYIDPVILNSTLQILNLENTKLRNISLDHVYQNLSLLLGGTTLPCDCTMKRMRDRGHIRTVPRCSSGKPYNESLEKLQCQVKKQNGKSLTS